MISAPGLACMRWSKWARLQPQCPRCCLRWLSISQLVAHLCRQLAPSSCSPTIDWALSDCRPGRARQKSQWMLWPSWNCVASWAGYNDKTMGKCGGSCGSHIPEIASSMCEHSLMRLIQPKRDTHTHTYHKFILTGMDESIVGSSSMQMCKRIDQPCVV